MNNDYRFKCPECDTPFEDKTLENKCDECGEWVEENSTSYLHGTQLCDNCLESGIDVARLREEWKDDIESRE